MQRGLLVFVPHSVNILISSSHTLPWPVHTTGMLCIHVLWNHYVFLSLEMFHKCGKVMVNATDKPLRIHLAPKETLNKHVYKLFSKSEAISLLLFTFLISQRQHEHNVESNHLETLKRTQTFKLPSCHNAAKIVQTAVCKPQIKTRGSQRSKKNHH